MGLRRRIIDFPLGGPARAPRLRFDDSTSIVPGDVVVCIDPFGANDFIVGDDGTVFSAEPCAAPEQGKVYVVADVCHSSCGMIGLRLHEFPGQKFYHVHACRKARPTSIEAL
ncbi:hypothetical protein FHS55_002078 [Angulomicrobium tetraedrale]|uniref:Uncharacterized protein n=1 Tax=Ancylobacter tetraedralis TaxID=217068 RepID=A0A839Z9S6_9HYPH|nr:hypothetical protein [Ancylobacter tetraedralis]MBB3771479.1 hypothetical protein [Ancylobacter tetraedralis]